MDESKLRLQVEKARLAQDLRANEFLSECFDALKKEYIDYWMITGVNDHNGRERLWQAVQIVGKVQEHLGKLIDGGKLATKHLSSIKTLKI